MLFFTKFVTACSGFDAFSQCIESYWSISSTTEAEGMLQGGTIKNNLFNAVKVNQISLNKICQGEPIFQEKQLI